MDKGHAISLLFIAEVVTYGRVGQGGWSQSKQILLSMFTVLEVAYPYRVGGGGGGVLIGVCRCFPCIFICTESCIL